MNLKTFLIVLCVALVSCKSNTSEKENYENTKESLAEDERKNPLNFLIVSGEDKRNMLGKTVINGIVENKATVCSFKDVRIKMLFYNNIGVLVANHEQVLDETLKPAGKHKFTSRYKTPKGTDSVALSVMSAEVVEEK